MRNAFPTEITIGNNRIHKHRETREGKEKSRPFTWLPRSRPEYGRHNRANNTPPSPTIQFSGCWIRWTQFVTLKIIDNQWENHNSYLAQSPARVKENWAGNLTRKFSFWRGGEKTYEKRNPQHSNWGESWHWVGANNMNYKNNQKMQIETGVLKMIYFRWYWKWNNMPDQKNSRNIIRWPRHIMTNVRW